MDNFIRVSNITQEMSNKNVNFEWLDFYPLSPYHETPRRKFCFHLMRCVPREWRWRDGMVEGGGVV